MENVRQDILKGDASQFSVSFQRDVLRPMSGFRHGFDVAAPKSVFDLEEAIEEETRGKVYQIGQALGVPLSVSQIREDLNFREPADDEDTLEAPVSPGLPAGFSSLTTAALLLQKAQRKALMRSWAYSMLWLRSVRRRILAWSSSRRGLTAL
jgi:hypothetical protein